MKKPDKKIVYKVCLRKGRKLISAWLGKIGSSWYNEYRLGKTDYPIIYESPLMAFASLEDARNWKREVLRGGEGITKGFTIFEAEAELYHGRRPREIVVSRTTDGLHYDIPFGEVERYWSQRRSRKRIGNDIQTSPFPDNTVFCSSIKLLKKVG